MTTDTRVTTTDESRPDEPGYSGRGGDARQETDAFEGEIGGEIWQPEADLSVYRQTYQQPLRTRPRSEVPQAPLLTQQEQIEAASALRGAMEAAQVRYPEFAQSLLNNPEDLWLLAEVQMMMSPREGEIPNEMAVEATEGLTATTDQRQEYEYETAHHETQQMFWNEVGGQYDPTEREYIIDALAQLSPRGANAVAAQALAWVDTHGPVGLGIINEREESALPTTVQSAGGTMLEGGPDYNDRETLLLNILNWSAQEQEYDRGNQGFFEVLDAAQELVEQKLIAPAVNWGVGILGGAEEAARRRSLTPGQQVAYMFGARPPENAGEFGWWKAISGAVDAQIEIGGDPLNVLAGWGAGSKAIKTIPLGSKATKLGRATAATRALLPRSLSGATRQVMGGRVARVRYALRSKDLDTLLQGTLKNGVAEDAFNLVKQGNIPKFRRLYPGWANLSDESVRTIQEAVESPEEFLEVLKISALNGELLDSGLEIADLTARAKQSERALRETAGETLLQPPPQAANLGDDVVYHGTNTKGADGIVEEGFKDGGLTTSYEKAVDWAKGTTDRRGGKPVVVAFKREDLYPRAQKHLTDNDTLMQYREADQVLPKPAAQLRVNIDEVGEEAVSATGRPRTFKEFEESLKADPVPTVNQTPLRAFDDLLMDQSLPRDVRLQAAKDRLRVFTHNNKANRPLILMDVPQKPRKIFSWQKVLNMPGSGRIATGVRRTAARLTPGKIPDEINLSNTRKGTEQLRLMGEHFGLRQDIIDDLAEEFMSLEQGARQDWIWDTFMRTLGRETGVPAFEESIVQFYKSGGVRNFSASGVDLLDDGSRIPLLATQMTESMPIPVEILTEVFRRARSIGHRPRIVKAMGFRGRGLASSTRKRRKDLMKQFRRDLGDRAEDYTDDQLYEMAYSRVSPNADLDGRGIFMGKMMPKVGSFFSGLHTYFTRAMLTLRPIQWMWRVALLEEPIRAHMYNMPSLYNNPLQYMRSARQAHYVANVRKWSEANMSWGQDVMANLLRGSKDDILKRIDDLDMRAAIFGDEVPDTARALRKQVSDFVTNALYGRTRPSKLSPIKRVPWSVKNQAHSIKQAEKALKKLNLPNSFDFHKEAEEISQRLVSGYLGQTVGASQRKLYQFATGMAEDEAFTHGQVWGGRLVQFVEDPFGRMALKRRASILRGETPDVTGHDVVNSGMWKRIAPDLRTKYPNEVDDVARAERYMDDMLRQETEHLFRPFYDELTPDEVADVLENFATTRRIHGRIGGEEIDWDLRSANVGGGMRDVGHSVSALRRDPNVNIPSNLPAVSFDPRFMAEDDVKWPEQISDWVLQTFGEQATQVLNRRPAWVRTYDRWYDNYRNLNIPAEHAERLAIDHANKMVNHVFFNMDEAPYYVARLNKILPFFGATYEVMGQWSYKMPVAVGGTWIQGAGEFARKFERIIDGLVNIGLLDREEEEDGSTSLTLNLVPPDSDVQSNQELGAFLQGAGFSAVNTLDQAVSTVLGLEEGLGLRSQGYRLAAGHPLNPSDYGILSFAQTDVGFNPATNILVNGLAGRILGAGKPTQDVVASGETVADVADRLNVDVDDLIRYNREIFIDVKDYGSQALYDGLLSGQVDPAQQRMPANEIVNVPDSSMWDAFSDTFMPFGQITNPHEFAANFVPGGLRWIWAGMALQNQPSDEFWKDSDLEGVFGGMLPNVNEAQAASQLNEAFMYLQAHDVINGKGPLDRIMEKQKLIETALGEAPGISSEDQKAAVDEMRERLETNAPTSEGVINEFRNQLEIDSQQFLDRAQKVAAESLILRGITGNFLPTTPGHVRLEQEKIREYWDTREYADSIKVGEGKTRLRNFKSMDEVEEYQEMLAAWLDDPSGDRARATFRENNPQLMAYLTPKTFYKERVPDIHGYEEYQRQIQAGEREPSPLHVSLYRARSAAVQADYYNKYISNFGNDPVGAAANALNNREIYDGLKDQRDLDYQALEMWDDMHGSVYDNWRSDNYDDVESYAQDRINDQLNTVRDNLEILFNLEDNIEVELDLDGVENLNSAIRGSIAEVSNAIRDYNRLTEEETNNRNPYEQAINRYFEEIYIPYAERISDLYDQLTEVGDSERQSLIYEKIKIVKNEYANSLAYIDGDYSRPFPNPLEFSWQGKNEEEQQIKRQQWITRPIEWMDLDQTQRLAEQNPELRNYMPTTQADFSIYREYTLNKIRVDEAFENGEITRSEKRKVMDSMEENLRRNLINQGRIGEVEMMDMTPYEKLQLSGMLPESLGIFADEVRYTKQALEAAEESPGTVGGVEIVAPLYNIVEEAYYSDPHMKETLNDLGVNLEDTTNMDQFLPWLFFGYSLER